MSITFCWRGGPCDPSGPFMWVCDLAAAHAWEATREREKKNEAPSLWVWFRSCDRQRVEGEQEEGRGFFCSLWGLAGRPEENREGEETKTTGGEKKEGRETPNQKTRDLALALFGSVSPWLCSFVAVLRPFFKKGNPESSARHAGTDGQTKATAGRPSFGFGAPFALIRPLFRPPPPPPGFSSLVPISPRFLHNVPLPPPLMPLCTETQGGGRKHKTGRKKRRPRAAPSPSPRSSIPFIYY